MAEMGWRIDKKSFWSRRVRREMEDRALKIGGWPVSVRLGRLPYLPEDPDEFFY
jgi:hypothetical protein